MIIIENLPGKSHPGKNEGTIHVSDTDCLLHPIRFKHCCHASNVHNILFPGTTRPIKYQLSPVRNKGTGVLFHSRISSSHQQHAFSTGDNLSPFHFLPLLISVSACSSIYVRQHCPSAINYRKVPSLSFTIPYCSYFLFFKDFYSFLLCHCYLIFGSYIHVYTRCRYTWISVTSFLMGVALQAPDW